MHISESAEVQEDKSPFSKFPFFKIFDISESTTENTYVLVSAPRLSVTVISVVLEVGDCAISPLEEITPISEDVHVSEEPYGASALSVTSFEMFTKLYAPAIYSKSASIFLASLYKTTATISSYTLG